MIRDKHVVAFLAYCFLLILLGFALGLLLFNDQSEAKCLRCGWEYYDTVDDVAYCKRLIQATVYIQPAERVDFYCFTTAAQWLYILWEDIPAFPEGMP